MSELLRVFCCNASGLRFGDHRTWCNVTVPQWHSRDCYTTCGLLALRQVWGKGVRAGMYPISEHEMYW